MDVTTVRRGNKFLLISIQVYLIYDGLVITSLEVIYNSRSEWNHSYISQNITAKATMPIQIHFECFKINLSSRLYNLIYIMWGFFSERTVYCGFGFGRGFGSNNFFRYSVKLPSLRRWLTNVLYIFFMVHVSILSFKFCRSF